MASMTSDTSDTSSSSKHNANKNTTRTRGPFHQSIIPILTFCVFTAFSSFSPNASFVSMCLADLTAARDQLEQVSEVMQCVCVFVCLLCIHVCV